jgi:hypothetical protein
LLEDFDFLAETRSVIAVSCVQLLKSHCRRSVVRH